MSDNTAHTDPTPFRPIGEDNAGYDPITGAFHRQFDVESDAIVSAIVETVGAVTGRDPITMPPLYDIVDPEALQVLLRSARDRHIVVTVSYEGFRVTVSNDGTIVVEPTETA